MKKGIFITATGTDVGKTYVTALIIKKLMDFGINAGYYKAALSGAEYKNGVPIPGDADYVRKISRTSQSYAEMVSYIYKAPLSPHLAAKTEGNPLSLNKVKKDFSAVCSRHSYITVEGSGGIVCPIRYDEKEHILLEDVIKLLGLSVIVVSNSGLGSINSAVTTCCYIKSKNINIKGIILNNYDSTSIMHRDNKFMIETLTNIPVIATVKTGAQDIGIASDKLTELYNEIISF